ncbi:MAG: winged helix-turn-helix transcriptional regulator [Kiritimatiellaeota bacterium]|nr:winged helix-turn-helix transcriptional regulator [Kiritimatiellota bacterium]
MSKGTMPDFDEYKRLGEPEKREKAENWRVAIGLQQVDGLTPSEYLFDLAQKNIEGELTIGEVKERLRSYYEAMPQKDGDTERQDEADKVSAHKPDPVNSIVCTANATVKPRNATVTPQNDTVNRKNDTVNQKNDTVFDLIRKNPHITAALLAAQTGLGVATVKRHVKKLKDGGEIERVGSDKAGYWKVKGGRQ